METYSKPATAAVGLEDALLNSSVLGDYSFSGGGLTRYGLGLD